MDPMSTQTSLEPAKSVHSVAGTTVKFEFSLPSGRRARAGVHAATDAAAGCPRPSTAPILVRSEAMDPDASPGLRCTRCAALCRPQARAEHQLDQALDARVASARR